MGKYQQTMKTYLSYARPKLLKGRLSLLVASGIAALAIIAAPLTTASPATPTVSPDTMASVGDSISARPYSAESWTTGTSRTVNSIHVRLESATGKPVTAIRKAVRGADSSALSAQMQAAITSNADLVTVLMGANDVCGNTVADMTSVATFRERYTAALTMADTANVKVVAVSIPNIYGLWEVAKDSFRARTVWDVYNVCQNMLGNPRSTEQADVTRRQAVKQRNEAYNATIASVCAQFSNCAYDGGAVYNLSPNLNDIALDYFHPDMSGQAKIAAAVWPAVVSLYPGLPANPPRPTPTPTPPSQPPTTPTNTTRTIDVTLPIRTNLGIKKIEITKDGTVITVDVRYMGSGMYRAKVDKSTIPAGSSTVTVRAWNADGTVVYSGSVPVRGSRY